MGNEQYKHVRSVLLWAANSGIHLWERENPA